MAMSLGVVGQRVSGPWLTLAVLPGLFLQAWHYLRNPAVWHDEAALILNVLFKDFGDYLGPLLHHEAAPPLFLVVERAACLVLGDSPYALRLVPFAASCASLVLFAWLASRWLPPVGAFWAVLLFGTSDRFLFHGCEAKPYAVDAFLTTAVLAAFTATRGWPVSRRVGLFTALSPVLMWLSFPGAFLCGGLLLAVGPGVWAGRRTRELLAYAVWAGVVGVAFLALVLGPVRAQRCGPMDSCWTELLADWSRPWGLPYWAVTSALRAGQYLCQPTGHVLLLVAAAGAWALAREEGRPGARSFVLLLVVPFGLAFVAALLGKYPFGGSRIIFYCAPAMLLLVGAGIGPVLGVLPRHPAVAKVGLAVLFLFPLGTAVFRAVSPWQRPDARGVVADVLRHRRDGEPVLCNYWQFLYYFRDLQPPVRQIHDREVWPNALVEGSTWTVLVCEVDGEKEGLLRRVGERWQVLERRDYFRATVLRLAPRPAEPRAGDGINPDQRQAAYNVMP